MIYLEDSLVTEKQKDLIRKLYTESKYRRAYNDEQLDDLSQEDASKHIEHLKKYKNGVVKINSAALFMHAIRTIEEEFKEARIIVPDHKDVFTTAVTRRFIHYKKIILQINEELG